MRTSPKSLIIIKRALIFFNYVCLSSLIMDENRIVIFSRNSDSITGQTAEKPKCNYFAHNVVFKRRGPTTLEDSISFPTCFLFFWFITKERQKHSTVRSSFWVKKLVQGFRERVSVDLPKSFKKD